jgi:hypothetical protein
MFKNHHIIFSQPADSGDLQANMHNHNEKLALENCAKDMPTFSRLKKLSTDSSPIVKILVTF